LLLVPVELKRYYYGLKNYRVQAMSVAVGISRIMSCVIGVILWYALLLQLPHISATAVLHRKNITAAVDHVSHVYSDVSEINSTTNAQFVPMFGAPGDIDSSYDHGSTIRLRLESHSGMTLLAKTLLRVIISALFSAMSGQLRPLRQDRVEMFHVVELAVANQKIVQNQPLGVVIKVKALKTITYRSIGRVHMKHQEISSLLMLLTCTVKFLRPKVSSLLLLQALE